MNMKIMCPVRHRADFIMYGERIVMIRQVLLDESIHNL